MKIYGKLFEDVLHLAQIGDHLRHDLQHSKADVLVFGFEALNEVFDQSRNESSGCSIILVLFFLYARLSECIVKATRNTPFSFINRT